MRMARSPNKLTLERLLSYKTRKRSCRSRVVGRKKDSPCSFLAGFVTHENSALAVIPNPNRGESLIMTIIRSYMEYHHGIYDTVHLTDCNYNCGTRIRCFNVASMTIMKLFSLPDFIFLYSSFYSSPCLLRNIFLRLIVIWSIITRRN